MPTHFYTSLPVIVYSRPQAAPAVDWAELGAGPGDIDLPDGHEFGFRIRNIDDETLALLIKELAGVAPLTYANLSENRKISDDGVELLKAFPLLAWLNLSSCGLSNTATTHLAGFDHLAALDLSYCNRLTGAALKPLRSLPNLQNLNLQGCVKITNGDVARLQKRGLTIKK